MERISRKSRAVYTMKQFVHKQKSYFPLKKHDNDITTNKICIDLPSWWN